jgi:hypothetical protein
MLPHLHRVVGNRTASRLVAQARGRQPPIAVRQAGPSTAGSIQRHVYINGDRKSVNDVPTQRQDEARENRDFFTKREAQIRATDWDDAFTQMGNYVWKINAKPGDKLYGLAGPRERVGARIDQMAWPTIDRLNNVVAAGDDADDIRIRLRRLRRLKAEIQRDRAPNEYAQLRRTYAIELINLGYAKLVGQGQPVLLSNANRVEFVTLIGQAIKWGQKLIRYNKAGPGFKKPCKAGIINALKSKRKVHFELSELDFSILWDRRTGKARSVTAAEIWKIFKLWMQKKLWRQPLKLRRLLRIRFYKNGKEVDPPWVTDPAPFRAKLQIDAKRRKYGRLKRYRSIVNP